MPKIFILLLMTVLLINPKNSLPDSSRAKTVRESVWPKLQAEFKSKGLNPKSPIYIRLFKDLYLLEVWVKKGSKYQLFKPYTICTYSGGLGTKIVEGDNKSPEGFYTIGPEQLNPVSNYHLAMNVGYPNKLERLKGYTGNSVMIHGNCKSAGCYAMTDAGIDEIYTLVYNALKAGQQTVQVDIFPFRMNSEHMKKYASSRSIPFWKTIKPGYDLFERNHVPAVAGVRGREYAFN